MEPLNGGAQHDKDPIWWMIPTRHKLERENTQQWTPYLTWFGQQRLHPRGGGFH